MLRWIIAAAAVILIAAVGRAREQSEPLQQYRAFWVDTFNTSLNNPADIGRVVQNAADAGANAIFAQVRRHGDSWYIDSLEPPPDGVAIAPGFDPLADLLLQAHRRGIEVHAFVIVCSFWNSAARPTDPRHVFNRHGLDPGGQPYAGRDNWLTRTLLPDAGTTIRVGGHQIGTDFWMEAGHPDAAAYTVDVLRHLVERYDIDGLHLDRIRYPEISISGQTPATGANIGYNETSVRRFQQRYGLDPNGPPPSPGDSLWSQWRRDQGTQLVRRIYLTTIAIRPRLKISAALIAFGGGPTTESSWTSAEAYWRVYQDWRAWTEEGILDLAIPMDYKTEHTAAGITMFDQWVQWTRNHQYNRLGLIGLGAFLNGVEGTIRQTRRALEESAGRRSGGVVFFSMAVSSAAVAANPFSSPANQNTPVRSFSEFASAVSTNVFAGPASIPELPWKTRAGHLMGFVRDAQGAAIDGATVMAVGRRPIDRPGPMLAQGRPFGQITADGNGFYGLVDLTPADYRIVVDVPGAGRFVSGCAVGVAAGEVATLSVTIDPRRPSVAICL